MDKSFDVRGLVILIRCVEVWLAALDRRFGELSPPERLLMGPGPANVEPRVLRAMALPVVGYFDPFLFEVMEEIKELLRYVFRTRNELTLPVSGTGSAGMEAVIYNLVERGDEVVVGVNGFFGARMAEMVERAGGKAIGVKTSLGKPIAAEAVEEALKNSNAKLVALVHGETSTGVLQNLEKISRIVRSYGALLVVDAVTTLGGCELEVDKLGIDACYSCSQKCLSCPPGLAPITLSERAMEKIRERKSKVQSWYLDIGLIEKYWMGAERSYHHTPPVSMLYGLREGLRVVYEQGIERRWEQHRINSEALVAGLEAMNLELLVEKEHRLPPLIAVKIPDGIQDQAVRKQLINEYGIEIGGGLGELKGRIWRIGVMGVNAREKNIIYLLSSLEKVLAAEGYGVKLGKACEAASIFYNGLVHRQTT